MALASGYINGWALTLYLSVMLVVGWFIYDNKDKIIKQLFEMPFLKGKNKIIGGGLAISSIACISILVFCPNLVAIYIARVVLIIMLQVCNVVDSLSPRLLGAELASKVFDQLKQGDA
jgi:hypothetical protein